MAETGRPVLDFAVVGDDFKTLATAVENKIEREFPRALDSISGLRYLVLAHVKITRNTSEVIRYLCADQPEDPWRKPGFCIAVFPLARTVLESLYSVLFLLDDPTTRAPWFERASWRDDCEELERLSGVYGSDPNWSSFLDKRRALLTAAAASMGLSPEEQANPRKLRYWPIPGQMIRGTDLGSSLRPYFKYLAEWFYGKLSAASHHAGPRLIPAMQILSDDLPEGPFALSVALYRSEAIFTSLTLHLALLSECISAFGFDLRPKAQYLWAVLGQYWPPTKALYEKRYAALLQV